jgi:hypothetical protein
MINNPKTCRDKLSRKTSTERRLRVTFQFGRRDRHRINHDYYNSNSAPELFRIIHIGHVNFITVIISSARDEWSTNEMIHI